jgi:hypothetical protein
VVAVDQAVTGHSRGRPGLRAVAGRRLRRNMPWPPLVHAAGSHGVSLKDAGGLPEVYFTVWSNVFDTAR